MKRAPAFQAPPRERTTEGARCHITLARYPVPACGKLAGRAHQFSVERSQGGLALPETASLLLKNGNTIPICFGSQLQAALLPAAAVAVAAWYFELFSVPVLFLGSAEGVAERQSAAAQPVHAAGRRGRGGCCCLRGEWAWWRCLEHGHRYALQMTSRAPLL